MHMLSSSGRHLPVIVGLRRRPESAPAHRGAGQPCALAETMRYVDHGTYELERLVTKHAATDARLSSPLSNG
jgi:hypothetical protein